MATTLLPNGFAMNVDVVSGVTPFDTLFIHGNLASNNWWKPALEIWKRNASPELPGRMIFAEWRGCGKSAAPANEGELHPEILAKDYVALLRSMNIESAFLVGHSTGGLIGLYAMLQAPELFSKAVLLDSVGATGIQFEEPMYDAFTQMSTDRSFCAAVMSATIRGSDASSALVSQLIDDAFGVAKLVWHGIPRALYSIDLRSSLAKIQQPVLVLHGEYDNVIPRESSVQLASTLPNATFRELKGQGHSANVENPPLFVQTTSDFLFS